MSGPVDILELGDERLRVCSSEIPATRMSSGSRLLQEYSELIATLEDFRQKKKKWVWSGDFSSSDWKK